MGNWYNWIYDGERIMSNRKKLYYPKGEIKNGLYTNGKEWMLEDGTEYVGDYHMYTRTNEVFTKSQYLSDVSQKLIPYLNIENYDIKKTFDYDNLVKSKPSKFEHGLYGKTLPNDLDYANGFYTRYFIKRHFQNVISEVSKDTFSQANDEFYIKVELKWKLTGPLNDIGIEKGVYDTNQRLVLLAENDMVGIRNYVTNYTEYARLSQ